MHLRAKSTLLVMISSVLIFGAPYPQAQAGSSGRAVAAGVVGAVGAAIIMQQFMNKQTRPAQASPRRKASAAPPNETNAANSKDPFAGATAPAGYARPVSNKAEK